MQNNEDKTVVQEEKTALTELKFELYKRIALTSVIAIIAAIAAFAYFSKAWYASNRNVGANNSSVTAESPSASLYICAGTTPDMSNKTEATVAGNIKLFPISTTDCKNWYYVSNIAVVDGEVKATAYTKANPSSTGSYTNSYEGNRILQAFSLAQFDIYTNSESMDVYLDPENPIEITYPTTSTKRIDEAVRIGLVVGGELKLVYAAAENAGEIGNSQGQAASKFYAIGGSGLVEAPYTIASDWSNYAAVSGGNGDYQAGANSIKLCTTDTAGQTVSVYIWLEGTDGQTKVGISDSGTFEADALSVKLRFVGV